MKNEIRFIVVQSGYAVFGAGHTQDEAVADAAKWMQPDGGNVGDMTAAEVEDRLVNRHNAVNGDFYIIEAGGDEFDDYLKNQGGFTKTDGQWYAD